MTPQRPSEIRRVGLIFAGGPAPGANAVIAAAAISFMESGHEVVGFFHGYSDLVDYHPVSHRLQPDVHYRVLTQRDVRGVRNTRGVLLGTARVGPGQHVRVAADLDEPELVADLHRTYTALVDLGIDALISIGGDGTLRSAWLLVEYQRRLPPEAPRVRVIHLPKTIDNDYQGIDFTFGFFTAVDVMAKEVENLQADAAATSSWFVVETMGRKAGWLSYGVAIAGEADLVLAAEDVHGALTLDESEDLDIARLVDRIIDVIEAAEDRGKHHGVVVLAEGLVDCLPAHVVAELPRNEVGQLSLGSVDLAKMVCARAALRYTERTGRRKRLKGVQLGYESRCAPAHAFDVMLGSQLGIGAFRGLVEEGLDAHMVSVTGQLDLRYVPMDDLVDPDTLTTRPRLIQRGSDLHRLARFLETRTDRREDWNPGRRRES